MNPDAEQIAAALDRERKERGPRGPLHGIPILIKDNIDTSDRMMTTAGSLALVGAKPLRDAFVAQKLREAGAVILGKTNLSEWANFRSDQIVEWLEWSWRTNEESVRRSSAIRADRVPVRARLLRQICARRRSARKLTAPSSVRRQQIPSSGSNRRSVS